MQHAKKITLATVATVLVGLFILSSFTVPVDAAAILESETSARAALGDSFYIDARGETFIINEEYESRALTKMHLEFEIVRNGSRGVMFSVTSGSFVVNTTRYSVSEGVGFAGRPSQGEFEGRIVFGFRLNLTDGEGNEIQIGFLGTVIRNGEDRPVLAMRGHVIVDGLEYSLIQRGLIRRI